MKLFFDFGRLDGRKPGAGILFLILALVAGGGCGQSQSAPPTVASPSQSDSTSPTATPTATPPSGPDATVGSIRLRQCWPDTTPVAQPGDVGMGDEESPAPPELRGICRLGEYPDT